MKIIIIKATLHAFAFNRLPARGPVKATRIKLVTHTAKIWCCPKFNAEINFNSFSADNAFQLFVHLHVKPLWMRVGTTTHCVCDRSRV